ncbi:MAG: histidine phosphatase family protein [Jatrophihabitans sp.]|nr:MAG: histidine phosphatase family protein [Jatrophihabitans sp.]
MVTVHLLRHGEVFNPTHVLYGRLPGFRLSELGERQAQAAADYLARRPVRYLACSPLERARQTARPLAEALGLEVAVDERLIEAANHLEGHPVAGGQGLMRHPELFKYYRNPFRPSWGEPYAQVAARVLAAARAAREAAAALGDGAEAVCVSHQLPIVAARRLVEGRRLFHDPRRRQCALASVTSFTFDGDGARARVVRLAYAEPAAALPRGTGAGA